MSRELYLSRLALEIEKYEEKVITNRENGKKNVGKTKETQNNPVGFSETQNNLKEKDKANRNKN